MILLAGCGERKTASSAAAPVAATVNKTAITIDQVNFLLQRQPGLKPEQVEAASRRILERLIDQELSMQKAVEAKLDADPKVLQQIDAARREIISRAYVEQVAEKAVKPSAEEVQKYYEDNPALFKDRRIYSLQELVIEAAPDQLEGLRDKLEKSKNVVEFMEFLKAGGFRFVGNQAVRTAEQLPLAALNAIAKLKDGGALFNASATGAQVLVLSNSRRQPVELEQAKSAIEQFLLNERKRKLIAEEIKTLRTGGKIEYLGKFVASAAPAASAPASEVSLITEPAASAASN